MFAIFFFLTIFKMNPKDIGTCIAKVKRSRRRRRSSIKKRSEKRTGCGQLLRFVIMYNTKALIDVTQYQLVRLALLEYYNAFAGMILKIKKKHKFSYLYTGKL